ncbi:Elicitin [Phytophthora megakarya]|uniref:Elicitin n=1 Tax=Phytophthora megakarya TaxID=4795 RepID=A0A225VBJ9_9STRA|nr:Elicitin [Phytophthora megakarya]
MPSLTSFVVFSLAVARFVSAEDCSTEALMSVASNSNLANCTADTGVSIATISTLTHEQLMDVCKSSSCMALMKDVAALKLGDCTIPGSNVTVQTDVLGKVNAMCGGSGMGSIGSMGSSSSTNSSTNVGDESASMNSDNSTGSKSSPSTSNAAVVTTGFVSAVAVVLVTMMF